MGQERRSDRVADTGRMPRNIDTSDDEDRATHSKNTPCYRFEAVYR